MTPEQRATVALLDLEVYGGPEAMRRTFAALVARYDYGPVMRPDDPEWLADLVARAEYVRRTGEPPWA